MNKMFAMASLEPADSKFWADMKCDPDYTAELRERYRGIGPGHVKTTMLWHRIILESDVPDVLIEDLIGHSVGQVLKNLPKAKRREYLDSTAEDIDITSVKPLSEMTNEELWRLFPIILSDYDPCWPVRYEDERHEIEKAIGEENILRISHIGSTAVPGLVAKPTIDILVEIRPQTSTEELTASLIKIGYIHTPQPAKPAPHMMFMKGYTPEGFKGQAFHLHVRYAGDWDEIYFRDYLISKPEMAEEYGKLKLSLAPQFRNDRDGYTEAKGEFVRKIMKLARR